MPRGITITVRACHVHPGRGRASLTERTILAGREVSLGRRRGPLAILPFTGPAVIASIAYWFVGIDWASQSHQVCLVDAHGECLGERAVAHGGPGIEELCDWLIARTGATPEVIGVAIEMTQGPVVEALLERGFCVYGINPKQLDRFRDRFTVAGAKSLPSRRRGMTLWTTTPEMDKPLIGA